MKKLINTLIVIFCVHLSLGQDAKKMALNYYNNGEYEKALPYFNKIERTNLDENTENLFINCLQLTKNYKEAEKRVLKIIRENPKNYEKQVLLGSLYAKQENTAEEKKHYTYLVKELDANQADILQLYEAFKIKNLYSWALETLEQGRKLLKNTYILNFQFAELYGLMGEKGKMYDEFLGLIEYNASYQYAVQNLIERYLHFDSESNDDYTILQQKIIERIQKFPDEPSYSELLIWLFLQKNDYVSALTQTKALDKRYHNNGKRIFYLAETALKYDYAAAIKCYQAVLDIGPSSPYYKKAETQKLHAQFLNITVNKSYQQSDIIAIIEKYKALLLEMGENSASYLFRLEYAEILGYYGNQPALAISLLEKAIQTPGISALDKAKGKIELADLLVVNNKIWDASLLYMQVETDFKYESIGHEAKFKNAQIFYFEGDFDYAQAQLNVLKASTSKLISNDAMNLSIFITDNLGIDSNLVAMSQFSKADLMLAQHHYAQAFLAYDSILKQFPFHSLVDDVLMRKAKAMQMQGKWEEAIPYLNEVYTQHKEDILADDAVFQLAEIYEKHLQNKALAKEWYKKILFEFKGSLHVVDARTRFRALSGQAL
jgi:tetratricopeptide (TPR) repeat protein